jgi:WD40 repeat protein
VALSSDGKYLATGSKDKTICLIDLMSKKIYHKFDSIHKSNNRVHTTKKNKFLFYNDLFYKQNN